MLHRVLVLGDGSQACLTIVRSLGRKGIKVCLGIQELESIVPYSRYASSVIKFPSTKFRLEEYVARLKEVLKSQRFDLVIPASDRSLVPIMSKKDEFEPLAKLAIPDERCFKVSYFKNHTVAMARELGIPIPTTVVVESPKDITRIQSNREMHLPLVVKPVSSKTWKDGRRIDLGAKLVREWPMLMETVNELLSSTAVLVQTHLHGIGAGQEFLVRDGVILSAFQHERVHEPLGGGGSSYRRSVPLNEQMLAHSKKMLSHLRWTGVVMIEYKWNPTTGEFILMEINGRFWGSLPLAVACGVDFPFYLYQLLVRGKTPKPIPYRIGLYCRNLKQDIVWFVNNWGADKTDQFLIAAPRRQVLREALNLILGRERWDTITLDDPLPGIVEFWYGFCSIVKKVTCYLEKAIHNMLFYNIGWRRMQQNRFCQLLNVNPHLLFVCQGNICRSPFAEAYTKLRLSSYGVSKLKVTSAGLHPLEHRRAPETARLISQEFGVDLNQHRSRTLVPEMINNSGAVVCMDFSDYKELRRLFPEVTGKVFFLKLFDKQTKDSQITDPNKKPAEEFRLCYKDIVVSAEEMIKVLTHS